MKVVTDDSIPDLNLASPDEWSDIDSNANENVGHIQRLTRSIRSNGITDEMWREGIFGNLEENHLYDESDWTPEGAGATGGQGYII